MQTGNDKTIFFIKYFSKIRFCSKFLKQFWSCLKHLVHLHLIDKRSLHGSCSAWQISPVHIEPPFNNQKPAFVASRRPYKERKRPSSGFASETTRETGNILNAIKNEIINENPHWGTIVRNVFRHTYSAIAQSRVSVRRTASLNPPHLRNDGEFEDLV
jgi:hypothetical protein